MTRFSNMMVKFISLAVFVVLILECSGEPVPSIIAGSDEILPENPCSQQGGICGLESFCPAEHQFTEKGLCPEQQNKGVECCRKVPLNIKDCRKRGGECMTNSQCGRAPQEAHGECPAGQVCCIML
ncbi:U-scoloptoxin(19)-Tl1a-like [Palaemon carinicauda]|uniref:U-scoloptoxin(19)-Tl1a-like n=1 Tax=Palaemon carinicauda TaxID=392227 RepID=UPI0035B57F32